MQSRELGQYQPERKATVQQELTTQPATTYVKLSSVAGVTKRTKTKTTPSHSLAAKSAAIQLVRANHSPTVVERKSEVYLEHGVTVKKSTHVPAGVPTGAWHQSVQLTTTPAASTRLPSVERSTQSQSSAVSSGINRPTPGANRTKGDAGVTGAILKNLPVKLDKTCKANKTGVDQPAGGHMRTA